MPRSAESSTSPPILLRTWIDQQTRGELKASLGADKLTLDQLSIRELERELAIAKMERDILMARGHPEKVTGANEGVRNFV
jgi:hypothetical protein